MDERDNDAGARVSDSVTKSDGTTVKFRQPHMRFQVFKESPYPFTLIFSEGMLRIFSAARTTTEKASLISKRAMSLTVRFADSSALGRATVGARGKSMGARPASAYAMN